MMLLIHIAIALTSMCIAALAFMHPSRGKLLASYALAAATLTTGVCLTLSYPGHILQACIAGSVYLVIVGVMTEVAREKLARAHN